MIDEDLIVCIDKAFGELDRPLLEELAAEDTSIEKSFLDGIGAKTWQEMRPLHRYIGDGTEIVVLSATAYQYYIPAYLVALVDGSADEFYLDSVLDSLWYETGLPSSDNLVQDFFDPGRGLDETLRKLETEMPYLSDDERKAAAQMRVSAAAKLAHVTELSGYDFFDESQRRLRRQARWDERMPLLTDPQKQCIARLLVHILGRTTEALDSVRIQNMLDRYWSAFLVKSERR